MDWNLADAKNRFSEVFNRALTEGPQRVRRRGRDEVLVVAAKDYDRPTVRRQSFKEFLMNVPSFEGVDLTRNKSTTREIEW